MRVYVVAPKGFDDPDRPSGGNIYDQRVCAGLVEAGWDMRIVTVEGPGLARAIAAIPDAETVLIDGLIASPAADQLLPHALRLRLVVLLHMPLATAFDGSHDPAGQRSEQAVLGAVAGVVVTSEWTRRQVLGRFPISPDRVRVARPGTDHVDIKRHSPPEPPVDGHLLCVAALAGHKGQDLLVEALAGSAETDWDCVLIGPLDREPDFVARLRTRIRQLGLDQQVRLTGVLTGPALQQAYAAADLLVAPSRSETYGMVVTEALVRGLPVVAADVGGLPESLGFAPDGTRPGTLVTPDDPAALAAALTRWRRDERYRRRLRSAASQRRATLPRWDETTREVASALHAAASPPAPAHTEPQ